MTFSALVAAADRAVQVHLGSVAVTYQPQGEDPVEVTGMFDERFVLVDQGDAGVEQTAPAAFLMLEDLPVDPEDDEPLITIGGTEYRVRERQKDGMGGIRLLLHRASLGGA